MFPRRFTGSTLFTLALALSTAGLTSRTEAALAQDQAQDYGSPAAPFTEEELQPVEDAIEDSLPTPDTDENEFNLYSEDEYNIYPSDDFAEIEGYATDIYEEQPGPADGNYEIYEQDDDDTGVVNPNPFDINATEEALNLYEANDLYDDDANDLYDTYEGIGDDAYDRENE